jgi:acid phosphatase family membrane protein YuiD
MKEEEIDRLLRSAGEAREEEAVSMPFGFDTRVVALWRAGAAKSNGVTSLLRRVALVSAVIIVASTIAAVREVGQSREIGESLTNEYAIADSAIQTEFLR